LSELRAENLFLSESGFQQKSASNVEESIVAAGKTYLIPTLQMNVINYREDEEFFLSLLNELNDGELSLATGYLNLTKQYLKALNNRSGSVRLLTSSPRANGFYKAGRVKKYIPGIYRVNEERMLKN
jgi:hypothetical protein